MLSTTPAFVTAMAMSVLLGVTHAAVAEDVCTPSCRPGYTCVQGACVEACNPTCGSNQVCTQTPAGADCVDRAARAPVDPSAPEPSTSVDLAPTPTSITATQCRPTCSADERCLQTSKGLACVGSSGVALRPSKQASRAESGTPAPYEAPARRSAPWSQPIATPRASENYAKPASITLGVLFALNGLGSIVGGAAVASSATASEELAPAIIVAGVVALGLGVWGIAAGAASD
jgi:hypothetical protein